MQDSFFFSSRMNKCLDRINDQHFWNPGVFSSAVIPRCRPNSRGFFPFIVTSIVYETRRTHQLLDWNPLFLICRFIYHKGKFLEVGVGDWRSMKDSFLSFQVNKCFLRVIAWHFWNLVFISYWMIPRYTPIQVFNSPPFPLLSHRRIYIL